MACGKGIKYRNPIKTALEAALKSQPPYLDGSPGRALGRWYYKVPGLFGGDMKKSETQTLIDLERRTEAGGAGVSCRACRP